eukprot:968386-Karenia_brevis.AAC.1
MSLVERLRSDCIVLQDANKQLWFQLTEAHRALGAWTAYCGNLEDSLRWHGCHADFTLRVDVLEQRLDNAVKGIDKLMQSLGQAVQDFIYERVTQWEASSSRVSSLEGKLELNPSEIQKSLDVLSQGFLSQLLGIFRDRVDALLKSKGGVDGPDPDQIDEEVETARGCSEAFRQVTAFTCYDGIHQRTREGSQSIAEPAVADEDQGEMISE